MKFKLPSGIEIGDLTEHVPVFMIAEVGSNWNTFDDCLHSIAMAKACGADAVKFQAFTYESLFGVDAPPPPDGWAKRARLFNGDHWTGDDTSVATLRKMRHEFPLDWLPKLKTHCDAMKIEFMCSAFSPELIDAVDPYVSIHKVASAELTHKRMLEKLAKIGKPVILSTGASGDGDIGQALQLLGKTPVCLLYCISAYPARAHRLEHIDSLRATFHRPVGFSDHSHVVFTIPEEAIFQHQACVLEKHVNFVDGLVSADSPHSLTTDEFRMMVKRCRNNRVIEARQSHEEKEMYTKHNRRLIATKDIPVGHALIEGGNFGIYRSLREDTRGLSPWLIDEVKDKKATRAIKAGDAIGPGDFA